MRLRPSATGAVLAVLLAPLALLSCSTPNTTANPPAPSSTPSIEVSSPVVTTPSTPPSTPGQIAPTTAATRGGGGVPANVGVTITRTGGLAGVMQTLAIAADGRG